MRQDLCDNLDKFRPELVRGIDIDHGLLNKLIAKKVIEDDHLEEIQAMPTTRRKNEKLLDILKRRDDVCYNNFRRALGESQIQLVRTCLPANPENEMGPMDQL